MHMGKCYVVVRQIVSWFDARDYCNDQCGRLLEVCDSTLNDLILELLGEKGVLIPHQGSSLAHAGQTFPHISSA